MNSTDDSSLESGASHGEFIKPEESSTIGGDDLGSGSSTRDETTSRTSDKSGDGSALGRQNQRPVRRSKAMVALVLLIAATLAAVATYKFLKLADNLAMAKQV